MKIAVVILNWNGRDYLRRYLPAVLSHSGDAEIIVADNASSDDSLGVLSREFPRVRQILNAKNLGFAGGYNEALKHVEADYFILLNSDVEVTPGWIDAPVKMMERDPAIAACQPKILSAADRGYFEYAGAAGGFIDRYGYPFCRGRIFDSIEKDSGQYDDARRVFWASGACMFLRAAAFRDVGGFDDAFFAHMEEIDLCWRLQKAGGTVWYCPNSTVYHVGGGTLHKSNPHKTFLNFRNNLMMLYKNLPRAAFGKVYRVRFFLDILAAIKFTLSTFRAGDLRAVIRAYAAFRVWKKKLPDNSFPGSPENDPAQPVIYPFSIVKAYYLQGKKTFSNLGF